MRIKTRGASRTKRRALALATAMIAATVVLPGAASAAPFDDEVTLKCNALGNLPDWTTDHQLTITPAAPQVGDTVTVTHTFGQGPTNGPLLINDLRAETVVTLSGAQSATLTLTAPPPIPPAPANQPIPGRTVSQTFVASAAGPVTATVDRIDFVSTIFGAEIPCDSSSDPAQAPAVSTPIATTVSVVIPSTATATITSVTGQEPGVTSHVRRGQTINFSATGFAPSGNLTASLCATDLTSGCQHAKNVSLDANGDATDSLTTANFGPSATTLGQRALVLSDGTNTRGVAIVVGSSGFPFALTLQTSPASGGIGTPVTVSWTGGDPLKTVNVGLLVPAIDGEPSTQGQSLASAAPLATAVNNSNGGGSATITIDDPDTLQVIAIQDQWSLTGATVFGFAPFSLSSDECVAGCSLSYNLNSTVTAGNLSMARQPGTSNITLGSVPASTQSQTSSGVLPPIEVVDLRGGTNGWSLVGTVTSFTGPGAASIPAGNLAWSPSCGDASGFGDINLSSAVAGSDGALDTTNAATLCSAADEAGGTGGVFDADADLDLTVDPFQQAGDYSAVLTITLS